MPNWRSPEFDWDDGNIDHIIDRHDVYPDEAEQVFMNRNFLRRAGKVYEVYGRDDSGRYLHLICVLRWNRVRVISARDMTTSERRTYGRYS
jgi:uncharacterized DUF497 family protein